MKIGFEMKYIFFKLMIDNFYGKTIKRKNK